MASLDPIWVPTRKVLSAGVGGLLTWALFIAVQKFTGVDLAGYLQPFVDLFAPGQSATGLVAGVVGLGIATLVPLSYQDIYKRLNAKIIADAMQDPTHPITQASVDAAKK